MIRLSVRDREVVQTLRVDADKVFVGRSPSNTIVLKEPSASRKHCMLRVRDGAVEILDLNSKHGLQINGRAETRALLSVGDRIGIGTAEIRLEEIETEVAALGAFGGYLDDQEAVERPLELKETSTPETTPEKAEAEAASGGEETTPATPPPADASGKSFADELYRTLRRAPAWAVSLALHTLVIALLFRVPWPNERNDELYQSIRGGLTEGGTPLEESVPDDLAGQDIPLPEFEEDLPPRPEIEDALPSSAAEESATLPEPPALPIIAPAPDSARIHVKGLGSKSKVALGPNKSFGTGESGP
jgi:predicted component of type VI protein secretion system